MPTTLNSSPRSNKRVTTKTGNTSFTPPPPTSVLATSICKITSKWVTVRFLNATICKRTVESHKRTLLYTPLHEWQKSTWYRMLKDSSEWLLKKRKRCSSYSMKVKRVSSKRSTRSALVSCINVWVSERLWTHLSYCSIVWLQRSQWRLGTAQQDLDHQTHSSKAWTWWKGSILGVNVPSNMANRCNCRKKYSVGQGPTVSSSLAPVSGPTPSMTSDAAILTVIHKSIRCIKTMRRKTHSRKRPNITSSTWIMHRKPSTWW